MNERYEYMWLNIGTGMIIHYSMFERKQKNTDEMFPFSCNDN